MIDGLYTIKEVSLLTGLSTQLIRKWEKRYEAVSPLRMPNGYRGYTSHDIGIIRWLKSRVEEGRPIGMAVAERKRLKGSLEESKEGFNVNAEVDSAGPVEILMHYLEKVDLRGADQVYRQVRELHSMEQLLSQVIKPALLELGERFERGELYDCKECFCSQYIREVVMTSRIGRE
ncbi:MerR family transcriptional regulator [Paenibacillus sp. CF384]|uniref:MerR family transcriptional regulator n=1 Tax=Paenibacillus sp. CF384 TaxID=1884382 RepID=UPI00089C0542|nr:MerR family transcriptional regulator [Paenibacillus sp. CF384]SDW59192.1 B12 binding domain-containing protein [Paenibacillus sp. CF384]